MSLVNAEIAIVGAGAVGSYYGALLARAGHRVTLIGRAPHVAAIAREGLRVASGGRTDTVALAASTELAAARGADLVLVCVKAGDTEEVARALRPWLHRAAVVLSLQNGVESAATLAQHLTQPVIPAIVYAALELPAPGLVRHHGGGTLVLGASAAEQTEAVQRAAALFATAGVPVQVSEDIRSELWRKLAVNCACNAISALAQANYAQMAALASVRELQCAVVREVVALAAAEGVALTLDAALAAVERIPAAMPQQRSSTAQDLARGKATEIDHLNGFVARRARALGIAAPVNETLFALVKLAEATAAHRGRPVADAAARA
jgi:2-dehydropantoate 2-reductase